MKSCQCEWYGGTVLLECTTQPNRGTKQNTPVSVCDTVRIFTKKEKFAKESPTFSKAPCVVVKKEGYK